MYNSKHSHNCQQLCMTELTHSDIREDIGTKKRFLSGIARITGTPPPPTPPPQFGQLGPFFSDIKIQDLKIT